MNQNKIAFNLYSFIRVEMKQHNNGKWKVSLTNRNNNRTNEIARSINDKEIILLCHYLITQTEQRNEHSTETQLNITKGMCKQLKNLIKTSRTLI